MCRRHAEIVSITEMQSDGCAWEPSLSLVALWLGASTAGRVGESFWSLLQYPIRAGFFSQVCVPTEAWAGKPQRGRTGNRVCDAPHTVLRVFSGTQAWGHWEHFKNTFFGKLRLCTHLCDFHKLHHMSKINEKKLSNSWTALTVPCHCSPQTPNQIEF